MLKQILRRVVGQTQPPLEPRSPLETSHMHRERAAFHLYEAVRPEGGLSWHELTSAQRCRHRELITLAVSLTDLSLTITEIEKVRE